jgi:hypothetical protein
MTQTDEERLRPVTERMKAELTEVREDVSKTASGWVGESPFFLVFERGPGDNVGIDIDTSGWIEANKGLFRTPGTWLMLHKQSMKPVLCVSLDEGDQFFFTKRHTGNLMAGREVISYGMGKKQADGWEIKLWLLPNGMICGGEDVDLLASRMLG